MNKVSREAAEQELSKLLDFRDVSQKDLENKSDDFELIVDAIVTGAVIINDDWTVEQALKYPITTVGKDADTIDKLTYKPRFSVDTFQITSQGIKPTDFIGLQCAQVSALTGISRAIIKKMDWKDFKLAQAIGGFF